MTICVVCPTRINIHFNPVFCCEFRWLIVSAIQQIFDLLVLRSLSLYATIIIEALRKKWPYSEFFRSIFSRIWTEYGEILRMRENKDQKNSEHEPFLRSGSSSIIYCCLSSGLHIFLGILVTVLMFHQFVWPSVLMDSL